jgi:hypothetical protein
MRKLGAALIITLGITIAAVWPAHGQGLTEWWATVTLCVSPPTIGAGAGEPVCYDTSAVSGVTYAWTVYFSVNETQYGQFVAWTGHTESAQVGPYWQIQHGNPAVKCNPSGPGSYVTGTASCESFFNLCFTGECGACNTDARRGSEEICEAENVEVYFSAANYEPAQYTGRPNCTDHRISWPFLCVYKWNYGQYSGTG